MINSGYVVTAMPSTDTGRPLVMTRIVSGPVCAVENIGRVIRWAYWVVELARFVRAIVFPFQLISMRPQVEQRVAINVSCRAWTWLRVRVAPAAVPLNEEPVSEPALIQVIGALGTDWFQAWRRYMTS